MSKDLWRGVVAQCVFDACQVLKNPDYQIPEKPMTYKPTHNEAIEALNWLVSDADREDREIICNLADIPANQLKESVIAACLTDDGVYPLQKWARRYLRD